MKKFIASFAIVLSLTTASCSPTWFADFKANPVAYITRFEQQVQTFLSTAATIFNAIRPFLPADKIAQIDADYNKAVFAVHHGLTALNDAAQAAVDTQQPAPDFSKIINEVIGAVDAVTAIVDEFRTGGTHVAAMPQVQSYPTGFADLKTQQASIGKYRR